MCICLNCLRIFNCTIYSTIAKKHEEQIFSEFQHLSIFFPQSPIIFTLFSPALKKSFSLEWDVNECLSFQEKPGSWIITPMTSSFTSYEQNFYYLIYDTLFESN